MEASEVARRIFWRHRWLLLVLMILPAAAVVPLRERLPVQYTATATVQGQGTTPGATTQVDAIHSRVSAVATAPALVQSAISQAKVDRDAVDVARKDISVTPLGNSAIMKITVTDPSARVVVALTRSLASAVVSQLNQLGVKDNPELTLLSKARAQLATRRDQLLSELSAARGSNAATSVPAQSLLSQLGAVEQQLASNESETQQVLAALTAETGAAVISVPTSASGASRHVAADGALAALLGLVLGLLIVTLREVMRPTVAQPAAGARELGAVLFGGCDARGDRIISIDRDLPERLSLAAHRAGVLAVVLTGPGSQARLAGLATRLRDELPLPGRAEPGGPWTRPAARIGSGLPGDDPGQNGDQRRQGIVDGGHRPVGLAAEPPTDIATVRTPAPQRTVVTLNDIRLSAPPPDAALVVVLPWFAPHSALDQAADLGVTADWPILGVIGVRPWSWLASLTARPAAAPDTRATESQEPPTVPHLKAPDGTHSEGKDG